MKGFAKTRNYTAPPMPWGIKRDDLPAVLRDWSPRITNVEVGNFGPPRGPLAVLLPVFERTPALRNIPPVIARVYTAATVPDSSRLGRR
ncbi:hypothetical protein OG874_13175 [Nocardia sp. NBC_00565]|uniref:hypothetical protein n=1 Tax=Nocardia sp. NBC_00565 TaxID=2975993 RepID=UPI002E7FB635|nr:hypothetical protein [Nocardia sp. NBC_00565]WUC06026.1 hypothetical protein OG874_13175 [Nocardia sp. NBC_00565]